MKHKVRNSCFVFCYGTSVEVRAGTPVVEDGGAFYVPPFFYPINSAEWHDATYHGYVIPKENVLTSN